MDMRKLLDLMEATTTPTQGVTGQKLAQTSGGQFMNRADRTNQAKVNTALGGAINPTTGKPYVAGRADTNLALAKKFSQPAAVPPAATNVPAPSADNEALKGQTIAKAMNSTPVASNPTTASADTRGAAAMASKSAPVAPEPATDAPIVSSSTLSPMDREEEIQRQQGLPYAPPAPKAADTQTAQNAPTQTSDQIATAALNAPSQDTRGAAAMASKSAPTQTSDQIATAALNAPTPDTSGAAAMASKSAPTQTSDQIATAALNAPATDVAGTSKNIPAAYGQMAEEELAEAFNDMLRLSGLSLNERTLAQRQGVVGAQLAKTSGGQFMNRKDRLNQAKVDAVLGPGFVAGRADTNLALAKKFSQTDPALSGDQDQPSFTGMQGRGPDSFTGMQGSGPDSFTGMQGRGPDSFTGMQGEPDMKFLPPEDDADTGNSNYTGQVQKTNTQGIDTNIGISLPKIKNQPDNKEKTSDDLAEMRRLSGLALNEKAVSKQQQKFMGMVHAMQKGEKVKGASPELKKAAKGMSKKDAKDFASTKHKGLPQKVSEEQIDPTSPGSTYVHSQRNLTNQDGEENFSRRTATLKTDLAGNQTVRAMDTSRPLGDEMTINANIPKGVKVNMIPQKVNEGMDIMLDEDGHTLKHIVNRFKHETKNFMSTGFMAENLYDALYDYYLDRGDMPYGIAKAREGDPYEWVEEHFYADMGSQMSEGAVAEQTVDPLSELARLAGLSEDGPGSAMLNAPKKDVETFGDKMRSAGKSIRQAIDRATLPKGMHAEYDRIEAEKDRAAAPIATPAATKADAFKDAMGSGSGKAQADDKVKEGAPGAAPNFEPRQRERVVSPKVNAYQKQRDQWEAARDSYVDVGHPDAHKFGRTIGKLVAEPIAAVKSAFHGASKEWDRAMGNDALPEPKPPVSVIPADKWKGDKDNPALKENDELNRMRKIAGLQECGDMGMERDHMQQKDRLNITTNMSSDGTRDVTVNAQGDAAEDLLSMLKLAGMERSAKPTMVMIDQDEEIVDEAKMKRITRHSNTPNEEYQTVDSIIRQGNDLNREKRQYKKEYPGDNPMAESILDQDLNDILESILIREEPIPTTKDPETGRVKATLPSDFWRPGKKRDPASQEIPMEPESPDSRTTGPRSMKVDGERTGTENFGKDKEVDEGWEDVSNFFGDLLGTEASHLRHSEQLQALDKMRQQYKGTPYEKQVQDRYDTHLERRRQDKGEVVGKDGEPIKVLPPEQWKGGK